MGFAACVALLGLCALNRDLLATSLMYVLLV